MIEGGRSVTDRTMSAGARAAEGMAMALAAALTSELTLAAPLERGRVGVPAARGRFEPADEVVRGAGGLAGERATDEDALDRLDRVEPGALTRQVAGDDADPHDRAA